MPRSRVSRSRHTCVQKRLSQLSQKQSSLRTSVAPLAAPHSPRAPVSAYSLCAQLRRAATTPLCAALALCATFFSYFYFNYFSSFTALHQSFDSARSLPVELQLEPSFCAARNVDPPIATLTAAYLVSVPLSLLHGRAKRTIKNALFCGYVILYYFLPFYFGHTLPDRARTRARQILSTPRALIATLLWRASLTKALYCYAVEWLVFSLDKSG